MSICRGISRVFLVEVLLFNSAALGTERGKGKDRTRVEKVGVRLPIGAAIYARDCVILDAAVGRSRSDAVRKLERLLSQPWTTGTQSTLSCSGPQNKAMVVLARLVLPLHLETPTLPPIRLLHL